MYKGLKSLKQIRPKSGNDIIEREQMLKRRGQRKFRGQRCLLTLKIGQRLVICCYSHKIIHWANVHLHVMHFKATLSAGGTQLVLTIVNKQAEIKQCKQTKKNNYYNLIFFSAIIIWGHPAHTAQALLTQHFFLYFV